MIRETSRQAYHETTELRHTIRSDLLRMFPDYPATAGEIWVLYADQFRHVRRSRNEIAKRLTELRDEGLIREVGKRKCSVTGRTCLVFELGDAQGSLF